MFMAYRDRNRCWRCKAGWYEQNCCVHLIDFETSLRFLPLGPCSSAFLYLTGSQTSPFALLFWWVWAVCSLAWKNISQLNSWKAVLAIFGTLESAALKTQCGGFLVPACAEACAPHFRWWVHLAEALKPGCTLNLGSWGAYWARQKEFLHLFCTFSLLRLLYYCLGNSWSPSWKSVLCYKCLSLLSLFSSLRFCISF